MFKVHRDRNGYFCHVDDIKTLMYELISTAALDHYDFVTYAFTFFWSERRLKTEMAHVASSTRDCSHIRGERGGN